MCVGREERAEGVLWWVWGGEKRSNFLFFDFRLFKDCFRFRRVLKLFLFLLVKMCLYFEVLF